MAEGKIPNPPFFKILNTPNYTVTIPANGAVNITANDLGIEVLDGYKTFAITGIYCSSNNVVFRSFDALATGTTSFGVLRNISSSQETATVSVKLVYCKSTMRS